MQIFISFALEPENEFEYCEIYMSVMWDDESFKVE